MLLQLQSFFKFYFKYFEQALSKYIIFLGDIFNIRTNIDAYLYYVFLDYLYQILNALQSLQIHLLVSNYDIKNMFN